MKAIVQDGFGAPETLRAMEVELPSIGPDDVLVRVHAAGVNPYDWHVLRGSPYVARLMPGGLGLTRPKERIAGLDAAGRVEKVGANVRGLRPGDEVFGFCPGAFAEYARAKADRLAPKPAGLSFEEAAALPLAATTALRAVQDVAEARAGQRLLVNGAAGGIGTCAVQIAAAADVEVTGVCGTGNVGLVRSIGAAEVVDYTKDDFTRGRPPYDAILDNVGNRPRRHLRRALTPDGTLVVNAGGAPGEVIGAIGPMVGAALLDRFVRQRLRVVPTLLRRDDLLAVAGLVESGRLVPVLDRSHPLSDAAEAVRYVERGHARGKVVLTVP
ncbi:NAD(P)-dependent alcohol dehydrogenase [Actinomadura chibensis]|uniref:NAD(P)-dependent alcohol dehydrogenase n=1 Tax=Actinomadura chibensis TaxID=392828 RepID=A0A5D0NEA9_9ACTN|nr:NAD(P)-dependent alcohol dehydrogenase [Actinomadura chibensis]TYB42561.1 NAD(P)-dependent alcohol dehydrogenase [Actinomadura chibensis]